MTIAILEEAPSGLTVIRDGKELFLTNGEELRWGDELVNNSEHVVKATLPPQSDQQTATQLTLDPGAKAKLVEKDTPLNDGSSRTEVIAMTEGVELYDIDTSTEVMGLVGGGAGLGLLGGAGLLAAGLLAGAAFENSDDTDSSANNSGAIQNTGDNNTPIVETGDFNMDGIDDFENLRDIRDNGDDDRDGIGNTFDNDDNNDGVYDDDNTLDPDPNSNDTDGDGLPNDQDTDDDNNGIPDDQEGGNQPNGGDVAGVTGALNQVSGALNETPLGMLSMATDALAGATAELSNAIAGNQDMDPSGTVAPLLVNTLGTQDPDYNASESDGAVGAVDSISEGANSGVEEGMLSVVSEQVTDPVLGEVGLDTGDASGAGESPLDGGLVAGVTTVADALDSGFTGTPLEQVIDPASETIGSEEGLTTGVAEGVGALGTTLANDGSVLSPLTADVLAPIVGDAGGEESGLSNALEDIGAGLVDLTAQDSALSPLSAVVEPVDAGVIDNLSFAVDEVGDAIYGFGGDDPSGLALTVGDLLGGDATGTESSISSSNSGGGSFIAPPTDLLGL